QLVVVDGGRPAAVDVLPTLDQGAVAHDHTGRRLVRELLEPLPRRTELVQRRVSTVDEVREPDGTRDRGHRVGRALVGDDGDAMSCIGKPGRDAPPDPSP